MKQYRRHDRAVIKAQKERTYFLHGKVVAKNRNKRCGQADTKSPVPSLKEFRQEHPGDVAHLTVKKSQRSYNREDRCLPGAVFKAWDGFHILQSNQSGCTKYWARDNTAHYYPASKCRIVKHNTGLVFL